jgi:hypothetical protein|nr:MAG TPA: hypothetical protein [Caudoviricetes sp.]
MVELKLNDISDNLLILHKATVDKIYQFENSADCIALYLFYYKTAKWQKTNVIKASDEYVKKCLKWGSEKIRKTKQTLKENGLINIVQARNQKKISGWHIEVCYIVSQKSAEDIEIKIIDSKNSQNQQLSKPTSSIEETNALKEHIKCLNKKIEMLENNKNNNISNKEKDKKENIIADIIGLYNEICVSLPKVKTVSNARKTAIKSLVNKYDIEQIRTVFTKAETSNFLKGNNNHSWQANFDWLIKDNNFVKVLDGNYDCAAHIEAPNFAAYDIDLFEQMLNKGIEK